MKYYTVRIERDTSLAFTQDVGKWEIPILELLNGQENVEVMGEVDVRRDYPDAESEYNRLLRRYKNRDEQNRLTAPPVELVYGVGSRGVAEMAKVIADERRAHPYKPGGAKASKGKTGADPKDAELAELKKQLEAIKENSLKAIERAEAEAEEAKVRAGELEAQLDALTSPEG